MNRNFEYKVSVIVPVYNAEKYLRNCLDSLVVQSIGVKDIEVLLVDDGSTDSSLDICKEYSRIYPCFKVFTKENEGVSITRNFALDRVKGKYIVYIDSDDVMTENTIEKIFLFFEQNYDEIDIVTYPLNAYYADGTTRPKHIRYQTLNKEGIYDICCTPFLFVVNMNIAVKNYFEDNIKFDVYMGYHEDQKYCSEILLNKKKLGFVTGCEYKYMLHENSITETQTNPIDLFGPTTKYWEELFARFEGEVPAYYQALYIHDLNWKLAQDCLLPYYLHGEEFETQVSRLWKLLEKVDIDIILKHPSIDNFHRYYFLEKKKNNHILPIVSIKNFVLMSKEKKIFSRDLFEIVVNKFKVFDSKLIMLGYVKSQIFNFIEKPEIFVIENNSIHRKIELFDSAASYYKCKTKTNYFWGFYYECDLNDIQEFEFKVLLEGIYFDSYFYMMPTSPFVICKEIVRDKYIICLKNNKKFEIRIVTDELCDQIKRNNNEIIKAKSEESYILRKICEKYSGQEIWLYYDCKGVRYDNGYLQFIHDFEKADGVNRYYVINNPMNDCDGLFEEHQKEAIVKFGSMQHKQLFIQASKIITAYIEDANVCPFDKKEKEFYVDIINQEVIYLQHGILHATLPWKYTPEKIDVDKVVASSKFEIENFQKKYNFRKVDILPCGMPRFEMLQKNRKPINKILFAPSWRKYLIGQCVDAEWQLRDELFISSKYYNEFQKFLASQELHELLEKNDLFMDFKIHPIFKPYLRHFDVSSERIVLVNDSVRDEEYCMFITDFSSYTFNFAYLGRSILYFVPDIIEFEAGLNSYRELDLPFDKAFGELVHTAEDALIAFEEMIQGKRKKEELYKKRMEEFFVPIESCSEKIYKSLRKQKC